MITVDEARARLLSAVEPLVGTEVVPLRHALGRVVATPLVAACDVPPADNSAMDGSIRLGQGERRSPSSRLMRV
ncbi:MAG: hypothetical protein EA416_00335, partial [Trueperaceae bacterium]